jgi:Fe-S-cluster-containing dehydrogenase component/DMSO reductase anchor subunit
MGNKVSLPLIDQYLREQKTLTAVEHFARQHECHTLDPDTRLYRDLIPVGPPGVGQQYAFEVDLDACTGCKACVTACHRLNGLDSEEAETWRWVGLLHGGSADAPIQQTVTTACHHCVDPACLKGCPVDAYEKSPITGIVKHLDDQCIGCRYCTLTCPYDVPQFSSRRGIVRKCDMCQDRLAGGEAPACVQACPNEAIRITHVDKKSVVEEAQTDQFVPAAPATNLTVPTTRYRTRRALPRNLLPADFYNVKPSEQHLPLVLMLVLTQLAVGAFAVDYVLGSLGTEAADSRSYQALWSVMAGLIALGASTLHLGRPLFAFRAIIGLKHSWLSREILAFGVFALASVLYAAAVWADRLFPKLGVPLPPLPPDVLQVLGAVVVGSGVAGVACSVMVYHVTGRQWWSGARTGFRFFMSAAILGVATSLAVGLVFRGSVEPNSAGGSDLRALALLLGAFVAAKLLWEVSVLVHLSARRLGELKRTAVLLSRRLIRPSIIRLALGVLGGLLLPAIIFQLLRGDGVADHWPATLGAAAWLLLLGAELLERSLFFSAVSRPSMPGGVGP